MKVPKNEKYFYREKVLLSDSLNISEKLFKYFVKDLSTLI